MKFVILLSLLISINAVADSDKKKKPFIRFHGVEALKKDFREMGSSIDEATGNNISNLVENCGDTSDDSFLGGIRSIFNRENSSTEKRSLHKSEILENIKKIEFSVNFEAIGLESLGTLSEDSLKKLSESSSKIWLEELNKQHNISIKQASENGGLISGTVEPGYLILIHQDNGSGRPVPVSYALPDLSGNFSAPVYFRSSQEKQTYQISKAPKSLYLSGANRTYNIAGEITIDAATTAENHLSPSFFVESTNKEIVSLAQKITQEKTSDIEKFEALYTWVSINIRYDHDMLKLIESSSTRNGDFVSALDTIKTKKGVCSDFAVTLIALARATGIKARAVSGYAAKNRAELNKVKKKSPNHMWLEVFINNSWVQVDGNIGSGSYEKNSEYYKTMPFVASEYIGSKNLSQHVMYEVTETHWEY